MVEAARQPCARHALTNAKTIRGHIFCPNSAQHTALPPLRFSLVGHMKPSRAFPLIFSLLFPIFVNADVTIYTTLSTPTPVGAPTTVDSAVPTTLRAYNNVICTPPAVPDPPPPNNFPINLGPNGMNNLSLPQLGSYVGYSIELSVSNQVCESHDLPLFLLCLMLSEWK
jgi:hypothetical protein